MDSYAPVPANVLQFSDNIPDPATSIPARLSVLLFDGENATNEKNIKSRQWSNGTTFQSVHLGKPSQPYSITEDELCSKPGRSGQPLLRNVLWPMTAIILPISLVAGVLIGLICGYRVQTEQSLFQSSANASEAPSSTSVLVDYSATRLVFLASWLSTMAPILASFVMVLWSLPIAQTMRTASAELDAGHLPTPYQLSLIIGVTLASVQRLRRYFEYALFGARPRIPPVLHKAAMMLTLCVLLAFGVFVADTALHYYTETVPFNKYFVHNQSLLSLSRGPSDACLNWNRTDSFCLPCSVPSWAPNDYAAEIEAAAEQDEVFFLQNNKSRKSEIRLVQAASLQNADLAILIPESQTIPPDVDFRSSTIGISTQCSFITPACNMRRTGYQNYDTQFNCSDSFYGVLGLPPVLSDSGNAPNQTADPNVPPLNWKPFLSLQYGYYTDPKLTQSYATGAFNSTTGAFDPYGTCVPDAELINPVYLGVASRFDADASTQNLTNEPGIMVGLDKTYADFVLSCSYTTYEVSYTWFNGSIQSFSFTKSPNGTVAEMYHGSQMYATITGGAHDLVLNILQAAHQANSSDFIREWADLYSVKVLSAIGAHTSARPNLKEQQRSVLLVAKVPTVALCAIIACSLTYVILGFALGFAAFRSSSSNVQDLAARLSLAGLTAAAFEERDGTGKYERIIKDADDAFSKQEDGTRRVGVEGLAQTGYILNPVVSPQPTPMYSRSASSREMIF
jgi:hypothetical protein